MSANHTQNSCVLACGVFVNVQWPIVIEIMMIRLLRISVREPDNRRVVWASLSSGLSVQYAMWRSDCVTFFFHSIRVSILNIVTMERGLWLMSRPGFHGYNRTLWCTVLMVRIFPPGGRNLIDGIKAAVIGFRKPIAKEKTNSTKEWL